MITVVFACEHAHSAANFDKQPICPFCGETRIMHVAAPAPRFTGLCEGPNAVYVKDMPAVNVKEHMKVKKEE